jgi:hypothetical protein
VMSCTGRRRMRRLARAGSAQSACSRA